ncbi:MAG: DNA translocase FtsK 4TM domain-containing protein [Ignavibacteriaceae bacterium]|nr:DNA translocase FtsK 4TM domain-containing protein [Ignavibacteriaceae bacterium]
MAVKKKRKPNVAEKTNGGDNYFAISVEKKKKILGVFIILFSILVLLSIISYSRFDQANLNYNFSDLFKVFNPDPAFREKLSSTHNWLGVFGAYISDIFINSSLGIFAAVFPVIFLIWGIRFFLKINFRTLIHSTNFLLVLGLLTSTFFGVLRAENYAFREYYELSGNVGYYLGEVLGRLLGGAGSIIFLTAAIIIVLIIAFDIKIEKIFHLIKNIFTSSASKIKQEMDRSKEISDDDKKLLQLKKLNEEKKKGKKKFSSKDTGSGEELSPQELMKKAADDYETQIRIIRKDEKPAKIEENKIVKEESKKVDLKGTGELNSDGFDKDNEAKLPDQWTEKINYKFPTLDMLDPAPPQNFMVAEEELKRNAELLKEKLKLFDIQIDDISVTPGPVVTLYEIVPAPGVKISRIVGLEHDIALALAARGIRIIAPIPGKSAIGVEIPNAEATLVNARSVLARIEESKAELPIALGKTINGDVYITDLAKMPHMLIAGSTGSGKSVGINMLVASLLYSKHPADVKLIMIDPKKIELSFYNKLRRHYLAVSPDLEEEIITVPQNAVLLLKSVEYEMEKRYDKLAKAGVRNIVDYNKKVKDPKKRPPDTEKIKHHPIPYLVVIIDELADLMITAGKEVEEPIARLAQLARAVGIHLVLATQRPSVNVITGVIKANFSARVAYQVATKIDSRTILDMNGAEQLLGKGDMLFLPTGSPKPIRIQNAFISTDEVEKLTNYIYSQPAYSKPYFLPSLYDKKKEASAGFLSDLDPMFEDAARVIVRHQQGSVSLLQRRLKLGYSRAARIVDQLEEAGIVGPNDGSKARTVIVENEEQLETILRNI